MFSAGVVLIVAASGTGMPLAAAVVTANEEVGVGCGIGYWGVKNYQNPTYDDTNPVFADKFGKLDTCADNPNRSTWIDRDNYFEAKVRNDGATAGKIAWQAIIQGEDPWGTPWNPSTENKAPTKRTQATDKFPILSTNDYTLKGQWIWTNDLKPTPTNADGTTTAWYLTNIWLKDIDAPTSNNYVVIDFMWDAVTDSGGNWVQKSYTDQDPSASGNQYSDTFCNDSDGDGIVVYHHNVILDITNVAANTWWERSTNINTYLNDAFNSHYDLTTGCTSTDPGTRSNFKIVGIETGIEIYNSVAGASASAKGGFSMTELTYP